MIVAVAIVIAPATIPGDTGTFKFIVNVSSPSTMLSSITAMFTVLLLVPAVITAVCMSELKSLPETSVVVLKQKFGIIFLFQSHTYTSAFRLFVLALITIKNWGKENVCGLLQIL